MPVSKTKVLWLIKGLGLGGAESLLVNALPYLDRDEFDYEVGYFLPWKDALVAKIEQCGIKVTCFATRSNFAPSGVWKVYRHLRRRNCDVLHAHLPWASIVGRAAAKLARVPAVIYTEHGCWPRLNRLTRFMNRATLGANDLTIAVSQAVAESMAGINGHPVRTITNGIDCRGLAETNGRREGMRQELGIPARDFVIVKVANLSPVKNHELLLEAFARFAKRCPDSSLVLVGQYRDRKLFLEDLASELGVAQKVVITGPRTDVPQIVMAADVFVMSSHSEGLPVSLLEAMALAKPVVCTRVGGIPGVVEDGEDGFLVPPGDAQGMAEGFETLASDPRLCQKMGQSGQMRIQNDYDIATMVRTVEEEYRRILTKKAGQL